MIKHRWIWWKIFMGFTHVYMRLIHRMKIRGKKHIPERGAIFYLLHNGDNDVIYFLSAFRKPIGVFTAIGNGIFADLMEHIYGWVPRRGTREVMVEKMIRSILKKNRYFVMWPEGTPSRDGVPMEAFSGIARVYGTLNAHKNIIPFQPVLMRGSETYLHRNDNRKWKILVEYLKPFYLPRDWLQPPEKGGKTPREIINAVMLVLAKKAGYEKLKKNPRLEWRRKLKGRPWK